MGIMLKIDFFVQTIEEAERGAPPQGLKFEFLVTVCP